MFRRAEIRKKDAKLHRYFSVVENRRVGVKKRTVQRSVLHLGEIDGSQEPGWRERDVRERSTAHITSSICMTGKGVERLGR
jgi:hypothetical protein